MFELGVQLGGLFLDRVPVRGERGVARQFQVVAIGVAWQSGKVGDAVVVLEAAAQGQGGIGAQVECQRAVGQRVLRIDIVHE
ncbi:hypothetical protein D3C77_247410 [compost metagenome]